MKQCLDILLLQLVRGLGWFLALYRPEIRVKILKAVLRAVFLFIRRPMRVARRNIQIAFPAMTAVQQEQLLEGSLTSLARLVMDAFRLTELDAQWVRDQVETEEAVQRFRTLKANAQGKGVLVATGHLSSFELLAHCGPFVGHPLAFIARRLSLPRLNAWFCGVREQRGNRVIDRAGATKEVFELLRNGTDVGVLFDHNVTRQHAVFVDFFGVPAATTRLLGLAVVKEQVPLCVACIQHLEGDRYRLKLDAINVEDVVSAPLLTLDQKVHAVTQRISTAFEQYIREDPASWFWIHARWKTRPTSEEAGFYSR